MNVSRFYLFRDNPYLINPLNYHK